MDCNEGSTTTTEITKTDIPATPAGKVNRASAWVGRTLDAAAPTFAPFAARWDAEANRRKTLRTPENLKALMAAQRENTSARATAATAKVQRKAAKAASKNPLNGARRAARTADKAATGHAKVMRSNLKAARKNYPQTLAQLVAKLHAVHAVPAVGYSVVEWVHNGAIEVLPPVVSAAVIAAIPAGLWLGHRQVTVQLDDELSAEERRLMERLDPSYWVQHADSRGLSGTLTERPEVTAAGIVCGVRLDAKGGTSWTAKKFAAESDAVRALLGMKTETRMQISRGTHGDRAQIVIRTRSASDGLDLKGWKPGDAWAIDTVTGETVPVPLGKRILIAGTSGSGKSTSARPLLAEASEPDDHRLVIFDRKYIEGRTWEHRARVAVELDEMRTLAEELIEEGEERLKALPRGEDTVKISASRPRITVFVDEMGELLSDCAAKYKTDDGKTADYLDVIAALRTVARKYRAAEIILVPATQKPTLSGDGHGLDSQIAGQLTIRLALAVATSTETQNVFGPDAIEKGWKAHELPMPWVALMRDQDKGPKQRTNPIRMRWMTAQQVIDLPPRPIWRRSASPAEVPAPATAAERPALRLVKDSVPAPREEQAAPKFQLTESEAKVLQALVKAADPQRHRDVVEAAGMAKATVSKALNGLIGHGLVVRDGQTYAATDTAKGGAA